jgi:hypothetical protein
MSVTSNGTWGTRLLAGAAVVAGLCFSANAQAFQLGVGLMAGGGGNFIPKPDPFVGIQPNPGFGGTTFGGGFAVDGRILPFVGLELDIHFKSDKGTGTFNNVDFTIGGSSLHVPILAKFLLPSPLVAPFAILGPEYVSPNYGDAEVKGGVVPSTAQFADSYWMFTFGLGMEIKLPLPVVDIRIPVSLRGSITPGASSDPLDRTHPPTPPSPYYTYNAEWQYAFSLNAGAQIYFF